MPVYYLCPDGERPAGGVRTIYRHVDILRRHGIEAFVVHQRRGYRCTWFHNETPVLSWAGPRGPASSLTRRVTRRLGHRSRGNEQLRRPPSFPIDPEDVLVIPEVFGPRLAEIAPGIAKVIFNQNVFLTFQGYPHDLRDVHFPYNHPEVVATIVASEYGLRFLEHVFPDKPVFRVRCSVDPALFRFDEAKRAQIAYMPRRNRRDALRVLAILAARRRLDGYKLVEISGMTEEAVAFELRRSLVFLSLSYQEGFGLPSAEAMACGAIVVGYDGCGGQEYLLPHVAFPVPTADVLAFANMLEHVLTLNKERPQELRDRAHEASAFIRSAYGPEREEEELLAAWGQILADPGRGFPAGRA
jgi:hypothetical protein